MLYKVGKKRISNNKHITQHVTCFNMKDNSEREHRASKQPRMYKDIDMSDVFPKLLNNN